MGRERLARPCRRFALGAALLGAACTPGDPAPALDLPARPADAPGGAEIAQALRGLDVEVREERIYAEIARGNVPQWLRELEPVEVRGEAGGRERRVTFWATPDYLAVGSDDDALLVPLSPRTGQRVADLAGASLPTRRMVDAVWAAARARLAPITIEPDEFMKTVRYFERHDRLVRAQRILYDVPPGAFVAGHKLDVVLTGSRAGGTGRPALYGWHRRDGTPIQDVFPVRMDHEPAFSQGVRLVGRGVLVDGVERDLDEVLRDPVLAPLLRGGGARDARQAG